MAHIKPTRTFVYKTVGNCEIALDLYLPANANDVPVLIWFHGGGCLQGSRDLLAPHLRRGVERHKYACVAADYRLAPQVGIADILEDVLDCLKFVRARLPALLDANTINANRITVSGNSAGGYLALLAGLYANPKTNCILPLESITDPLGQFFTTSQPISSDVYLASREELAEYLDPNGQVVSRSGWIPDDPRANLYVRMLHDANLAELLRIPKDEAEARRFRVARQIQEHGLPPTYFLHGVEDVDVGVSQSDEVVGAAIGCGIEVVYERVPGAGHYLANGLEYNNEALFAFMKKHVYAT